MMSVGMIRLTLVCILLIVVLIAIAEPVTESPEVKLCLETHSYSTCTHVAL